MSVDPIEDELTKVRRDLEVEVAAHHDAALLLSRLERAARDVGMHRAEDQQLLREVRAALRARGWRVSTGLYAPISPSWAGDPPPWSK